MLPIMLTVVVGTTGVMAAGNNANIFRPSGIVPGVQNIQPNAQLVQSGDAVLRVNQLEDQIRQLNGTIEELNFQLLQMQEQMRRMQEDNEFRFRELENKQQGSVVDGAEKTLSKLDNGRVRKEYRLEKLDPSGLDDNSSIADGEIAVAVPVTVTNTSSVSVQPLASVPVTI